MRRATQCLLSIHRTIRALEQGTQVVTVLRADRNADAACNRDRLPVDVDRLLHVTPYALDNRSESGMTVLRLQEKHELVAANSRDEIARSRVPCEPRAHRTKHLVSRGVSVCVIDELEAIEVNDGNSEQVAFSERLHNRSFRLFDEQAPVRQACERIVVGLALEAAYEIGRAHV